MDIQLYATDEELKEFPEDKTDSDKISGPNNIHLSTSDLPRPLTDLPRPPTSLPTSTAKARCRHKAKRSHAITRQDLPSKNPIVTHSVIQVNECLSPIQEKGSLIQMSACGLPVRSVIQSVTHSAHGGSACSQSARCQSAWSRSVQSGPALCSHPMPLLSLQLQPDLNVLARTLTSQALQYIHIRIQIGRMLSK